MKKIIFLALLIVVLIAITGCDQRDVFYYKGVSIENSLLTPSSDWTLHSATYDSIRVFYNEYSKNSIRVGRISGERWSVPVEPKTMQILGFHDFANLNSPCKASHLIRGKRFLLENRAKIQYILNTVRDCPAVKESGTKVPE